MIYSGRTDLSTRVEASNKQILSAGIIYSKALGKAERDLYLLRVLYIRINPAERWLQYLIKHYPFVLNTKVRGEYQFPLFAVGRAAAPSLPRRSISAAPFQIGIAAFFPCFFS